MSKRKPQIEEIPMGSQTGETENAVVPGGWAGTDDAFSTAPSDQIGNPKPADKVNLEDDLILEDQRQVEAARLVDEKQELDEAESRSLRHRLAELIALGRHS
ncbi:hypothetical protein K2X33_08030 [bacterium]|nr:hypothetical protein [bacterium]